MRTANKAFYTLFKTNIDRTEGSYFFEMENGQWNMPELKKRIAEIIQKGKSMENFEINHVFPSIGEKSLLVNAMRMHQEDNKKNRILLVIQDVTDRNKAVRELKEREERFRLLLQNTFDIMTIYTAEGNIVYQSEALERSLGYTAMETMGKNIFDLGIVHPEDLDIKKKLFGQALKSPGKNIKGRLRMQHKNNSYKKMDVIFRNLLNNHSIKGIVANYQSAS